MPPQRPDVATRDRSGYRRCPVRQDVVDTVVNERGEKQPRLVDVGSEEKPTGNRHGAANGVRPYYQGGVVKRSTVVGDFVGDTADLFDEGVRPAPVSGRSRDRPWGVEEHLGRGVGGVDGLGRMACGCARTGQSSRAQRREAQGAGDMDDALSVTNGVGLGQSQDDGLDHIVGGGDDDKVSLDCGGSGIGRDHRGGETGAKAGAGFLTTATGCDDSVSYTGKRGREHGTEPAGADDRDPAKG